MAARQNPACLPGSHRCDYAVERPDSRRLHARVILRVPAKYKSVLLLSAAIGLAIVALKMAGQYLHPGSAAIYTREGDVVERWNWPAQPWATESPRPPVVQSYEQTFTTPTGVALRVRMETGVTPYIHRLDRARTPVSAEVVVVRNPLGHAAAQLLQPHLARGEHALTDDFAAFIYPQWFDTSQPMAISGYPADVLCIGGRIELRTLAGRTPVTLNYGPEYLVRVDVMDLQLCGDGRILLQKSGNQLNSCLSIDVRRLCSVVERP